MSRLTLVEGLLMNLKREINPGRREYLPPELAHQRLVHLAGQDLGEDIDAWRRWFKNEKKSGDRKRSCVINKADGAVVALLMIVGGARRRALAPAHGQPMRAQARPAPARPRGRHANGTCLSCAQTNALAATCCVACGVPF